MGLAYYLPIHEPINRFISPYVDKVLTLRPFHYGYLYSVNIIVRIDQFFPDDKIKIFVRLRKNTPSFGKFIGT